MEATYRSVRENVESVRARIDAAANRAGRRPESVRLMAVTKTRSLPQIEAAYAAGVRLFGENLVRDAGEKYRSFRSDAELHLIGHLQRNKVRAACDVAACVESVDKLATAEAIAARCREAGRAMDVLLEVNTSGEATKSGFASRDGLVRDLEAIRFLPSVTVRGLMTVGPLTDDERSVRRAFRSLWQLREELRAGFPGVDWSELSMGMSGDFEIAVEEGATIVRIGAALFGARPTP